MAAAKGEFKLTRKEREHFKRLFELAERLDALNPWEWMTMADCFGIQPRDHPKPFFAIFGGVPDSTRFLRLLEGVKALFDLITGLNNPADKELAGLLDIPMLEVMYMPPKHLFDWEVQMLSAMKQPLKKSGGNIAFRRISPGYYPSGINLKDAQTLEDAIYQTCGMVMRVESDGMLLKSRFPREVLVRRQSSTGEWYDEWLPLTPPTDVEVDVYLDVTKLLSLESKGLLPLSVQIDVVMLPLHPDGNTNGKLIDYAVWIVDSDRGNIITELHFTAESGIEKMWAEIPPQLINFFDHFGGCPEKIEVREGRMTNLLRPFSERIPFKMVHYKSLDKIEKNKESIWGYDEQA